MQVIKANIPLPHEARTISNLLKAGDQLAEVYAVGGAVRDWLFHKFHSDQSQPFKCKDIDLTTNLSEEEILRRLRTPLARKFGVIVNEKQSVDTFGVVFVGVNGKGFEVAPFRKDIGSSDGRHPDKVECGTIYEDAMRRDLTINNLYYDFDGHDSEKGLILDFNKNGQGIEDIKSRNVRTVGDPFDRFEEDKLRILRMVRFFSRYNGGLIVEWLDRQTRNAVDHFKKLHDFKGMSHERVQTEFLAGLSQSIKTSSYLKNYLDLDLFEAVFPGCKINADVIPRLGDLKNQNVVLAMLLNGNNGVWETLNAICYPNDVSDPVAFLIGAMNFDPEDAVDIIKVRDKKIIKTGKKKLILDESDVEHNKRVKDEMVRDMKDLISLTDDKQRRLVLEHLATYSYSTIPSGESFMRAGHQGAEIGIQQRKWIQADWNGSLRWHLYLPNK